MKDFFRLSNSEWKKKLAVLLLICLPFTYSSAQISLSVDKQTLTEVIESIKGQSNYEFFYDDSLGKTIVENIHVENGSIEETLTTVFKHQNISYTIKENVIYLSPKQEENPQKGSQSQKKVTGQVVDANQEPMIGVAVIVPGTTTGSITDIDGNFSIDIPAGSTQLEFSYIGYVKQTVAINNQTSLNVILREDTQMIDEVVVTALGIKREKKLLGYSIQELKSDDLNTTGNASVSGALQGKIAGVQMNISPTGLNGSTKITIRGNSSLTDNNQPLWIVDGVPFNDSSDSSVSLYGGVDRGGASIDINPEDIETISVLKGPNAAALYGSRAGNGVILITTKKGAANKGLGISYNNTLTWTQVAETLDLQTTYGQGLGGVYSSGTPFSYGSKLDGSKTPGWWRDAEGNLTTATSPYAYNGNKLKDYFNTGFSQNHNVSVSNATEDSHYRASFGFLDSKGLFDGEGLKKVNMDVNAGRKINKFLSADSKVSLSKTTANNRPYVGKDGEMYQLLLLPNNIRLSDLQQHYTRKEEDLNENSYNIHQNWLGPDENIKNPYWVHNQRTNMDDRWRVFAYQTLKLDITSWLTAVGKVSIDYYRTKLESTNKGNGNSAENIKLQDEFQKEEDNFYEMNYEFMLLGNNRIGDKVRINYTAGANRMHQRREVLTAKARNMYTKNHWYLNNAGTALPSGAIPTTANQLLNQKRVNSVYGSFQFAYDEYISVDGTFRWDWSSTLEPSYNYPSINLSFIGTEFLNKQDITLPSWLTYGKVRFSWAKAGKDTEPYQLQRTVEWREEFTGPQPTYSPIYIGPDLRAEISESFETGLEMKFLNNRLGFDFTYYHSITRNQVMTIPRSSSSKVNQTRINAGKIKNEGVEFALYSIPVRTRDFEFGLDLNMAHNVTTIKELHPEKKTVDFGNVDKFFFTVGGVEGGKLGDIYAKRMFKRDENNNMIINKHTGLPETISDNKLGKNRLIGNIQPKLMMSVAPRFIYKNITLSALFDMKFGGEIVSVTEAIATHYGTAKRTENRNEKVVLAGVYSDGTPNQTEISYEDYYKFISNTGTDAGVAEEFVYDASYIKLRELAFGYSLPKKWLTKTPINTFRVSFVARNLCYLMKHTPGTNPEGGFSTSMYSQAFDYLSTPNSRTLGFSINVDF